jgi:hypothetical protein
MRMQREPWQPSKPGMKGRMRGSLFGANARLVLAVDRLEYIAAIGDAIKGLETARVTLAKIIPQLDADGNHPWLGNSP